MRLAIAFSIGLAIGTVFGLVVSALSRGATPIAVDSEADGLRDLLKAKSAELAVANKTIERVKFDAFAADSEKAAKLRKRDATIAEAHQAIVKKDAELEKLRKAPQQQNPILTSDYLGSAEPRPRRVAGSSGEDVDGFVFSGCKLSKLGNGCLFKGTVTNKTGVDCRTAYFHVSLYDGRGELIDVATMLISNIPNGESRDFSDEFLSDQDRNVSEASSFKVALRIKN